MSGLRSECLEREPEQKEDLKPGEKGKAPSEIPVSGLMPKSEHPQGPSPGSSQKGPGKEGAFTDPPSFFPGPLLIHTHETEEENPGPETPDQKESSHPNRRFL